MNVAELDRLLKETNYDECERKFVVNSFTNGFPLGYQNDQDVQMESPNLRLECGSHRDMWDKIMKEVTLGRYAGPFESIPFKRYIQSPLGLVPKGEKDVRLIFHLSYPRSSKEKKSVNACMPKELCTVKYSDSDMAIQMCIEAGKGCLPNLI